MNKPVPRSKHQRTRHPARKAKSASEKSPQVIELQRITAVKIDALPPNEICGNILTKSMATRKSHAAENC